MFKIIINFIIGLLLLIYSFYSYLIWNKPIESQGFIHFLKGNELVLKSKNPKDTSNSEKALDEYKIAMKTNTDVNIKKNFELILKKKEEQQKQENQKKDQKNKNNEDKKENNKKQEQNKKNDSKDQNKNEKNNKKQENQQQSKSEKMKENQKKEELQSILNRLEGNEKQAFKNNEKIKVNLNNENTENRW
ncbi:hypothetical protein [uncultured Cetobacterium sp.]|uniref:hypothetical protein n=1 Tax=uncultured Cetobacterium sp. TaxID=527638 RepID=UPI0026178C94|nr:hypothetical protein [uncultured Cetobacterium sp.]